MNASSESIEGVIKCVRAKYGNYPDDVYVHIRLVTIISRFYDTLREIHNTCHEFKCNGGGSHAKIGRNFFVLILSNPLFTRLLRWVWDEPTWF